MITIGIRAAPTEVTFAIYDANEGAVINVESINVPSAFDWPECLKYIRSNLLDVMREYKVSRAGIRLSEPTAQSISYERIHIEGVIQEAFASSDVNGYFQGPIATIAKRVGVERTALKIMIDGENTLEIEGWDKLSGKQREAIITAIGASNV